MNKRVVRVMVALVLTLALVIPASSLNVEAATVKLSKSKATMEVDSTLKLKVTGTSATVKWKSSNKTVAKVYKGKVTALKEGTATITATVNKKDYQCAVTVVDNNKSTSKEKTGKKVTNGTITVSTDYVKLTDENPTAKVTVTSTKWNGVARDIGNYDIAETAWSDWYGAGNVVDITISGQEKGSTTIKIYDQKTFDYVNVTVDVDFKDRVEIELPDTPITLHEYSWGDDIEQTYKLDKIWYDCSNEYDGKCTITLHFSGSKSYDYRGKGQSSSAVIGWKLYDMDGYVVDSGTCYAPGVRVDDKWKDADYKIYDVEPGKYRLEVLSVN